MKLSWESHQEIQRISNRNFQHPVCEEATVLKQTETGTIQNVWILKQCVHDAWKTKERKKIHKKIGNQYVFKNNSSSAKIMFSHQRMHCQSNTLSLFQSNFVSRKSYRSRTNKRRSWVDKNKRHKTKGHRKFGLLSNCSLLFLEWPTKQEIWSDSVNRSSTLFRCQQHLSQLHHSQKVNFQQTLRVRVPMFAPSWLGCDG